MNRFMHLPVFLYDKKSDRFTYIGQCIGEIRDRHNVFARLQIKWNENLTQETIDHLASDSCQIINDFNDNENPEKIVIQSLETFHLKML